MAADKPKVLLIEDEPYFQKQLASCLAEEGVELTVAGKGGDGIIRAKELKPDLILLDLMLPDMNGVEIFKKLRSGRDTKKTPVMVLTAVQDRSDVLQASMLALGVQGFMAKPVEKAEFLAEVRRLLGRPTSPPPPADGPPSGRR